LALGPLVISIQAAAWAGSIEIKVGLLRSVQNAGVFVAQQKGYFAVEGLQAQLVFFNGARQIPLSVASHQLDFGAAGTTVSLFKSASEGSVRVIGGVAREAAGYPLYGLAVSRPAYEAGLKSYQDLPGHSVAIATVGAPAHYSLALIAERYGFALSDVQVLPLESYANMVSMVSHGQADAGIIPATQMMPAISRGALKLIGWIGDEAPWQVSVIFTAADTADQDRDTVIRFLRAYRRGAREYHDAFAGADGKRADGPTAPNILSIVAQYIGQSVEQIKDEIAYVDPAGRLDVKDVLRQIKWYRAQGLLDPLDHTETAIDKRYVIPFPNQ
jgi:NitT/TauT family transport system substrate-binding protein